MGFHKLAFIALLVILTLLSWPMALTAYLGFQQEHEMLWRERVRLATEDALREMRESSIGYGSNSYHINLYDAQEGIDVFFQSLSGIVDDDATALHEGLYPQIPYIIAFDSHGYVINAYQPVNVISSSDQEPIELGVGRYSLPRRYYLLQDEKSLYWLSHGDLLTAMPKSTSAEKLVELASGYDRDSDEFIQGTLDALLDRASAEQNFATRFPLLARVTSKAELKLLFLNASLEEIQSLLSDKGYFTQVPDFFVQMPVTEMNDFEFSGFCSFLAKEKFGTRELQLESIVSWGAIESRQDVYGFLENGIRVYCYLTCKQHLVENVQGVFPNFKAAAEKGFLPCSSGVLKQN